MLRCTFSFMCVGVGVGSGGAINLRLLYYPNDSCHQLHYITTQSMLAGKVHIYINIFFLVLSVPLFQDYKSKHSFKKKTLFTLYQHRKCIYQLSSSLSVLIRGYFYFIPLCFFLNCRLTFFFIFYNFSQVEFCWPVSIFIKCQITFTKKIY